MVVVGKEDADAIFLGFLKRGRVELVPTNIPEVSLDFSDFFWIFYGFLNIYLLIFLMIFLLFLTNLLCLPLLHLCVVLHH